MALSDKVIIITGAARGLGQTYARRFAELGNRIVVCDQRDCDQTVAQCEEAGAQAIGFETDVTDGASAQAMADRALAQFGRIDVLINNAALFGSLSFAPFDKLDEGEWDATINVNVKGIWHCSRAVVPAMREAGGMLTVTLASLPGRSRSCCPLPSSRPSSSGTTAWACPTTTAPTGPQS